MNVEKAQAEIRRGFAVAAAVAALGAGIELSCGWTKAAIALALVALADVVFLGWRRLGLGRKPKERP